MTEDKTKLKDNCEFYCLSYNSPERAHTMKTRFQQLNLHLNVHTGVQMDDSRLQETEDMSLKRLWSCCYGHLDNLQAFYNSGKKYGFLCEDDVHIRKDFVEKLPAILAEFEEMKLDVLLLGYMTTFPICDWIEGYKYAQSPQPARPYQYFAYPENQWGIHFAMFSREYAKRLIDEYAHGYAKRTLTETGIPPFNPDWTLTKLSSSQQRALIYPMMAVEDGKGHYDHWGQGEFHRNSHLANYIPEEFY